MGDRQDFGDAFQGIQSFYYDIKRVRQGTSVVYLTQYGVKTQELNFDTSNRILYTNTINGLIIKGHPSSNPVNFTMTMLFPTTKRLEVKNFFTPFVDNINMDYKAFLVITKGDAEFGSIPLVITSFNEGLSAQALKTSASVTGILLGGLSWLVR